MAAGEEEVKKAKVVTTEPASPGGRFRAGQAIGIETEREHVRGRVRSDNARGWARYFGVRGGGEEQ